MEKVYRPCASEEKDIALVVTHSCYCLHQLSSVRAKIKIGKIEIWLSFIEARTIVYNPTYLADTCNTNITPQSYHHMCIGRSSNHSSRLYVS